MLETRKKRCRVIEELSNDLRDNQNIIDDMPYSEELIRNVVKSLKSEPSLDSELIGRKKELNEIKSYIERCIDYKKSGIVYISGSPGTGKTCTVERILRLLEEGICKKTGINKSINHKIIRTNTSKMAFCSSNNVATLNISFFMHLFSLMKFSKSSVQNFKKIYQQQGYKEGIAYFIKELINKRTKFVVFIDEIDLIKGKNNCDVILELFRTIIDHPESNIVLITISNTVQIGNDIIKKLKIDAKKDDKIKLMVFSPYDHITLREIVMQRISTLKNYGKDAINTAGIELCVRKIASIYGDCRRTLDACYLAIGKFLVENQEGNVQYRTSDELNIDQDNSSDRNSSTISTKENTPVFNRFNQLNSHTNVSFSLRTRSLPANTALSFGNFQNIMSRIHHTNQNKINIIHSLPLHQQYAVMGIVLAIVEEYLRIREEKQVILNKELNDFSLDKLIDSRVSTIHAKNKYNYICKEFLSSPEEYKDMLDALESNNIIITVNDMTITRKKSNSFHRNAKTMNPKKESMIELMFPPEQVINALATLPKLGSIFSRLLPDVRRKDTEKLD